MIDIGGYGQAPERCLSAAASPLGHPSGKGSLFGPGGQPYEQADDLPGGCVAAHGHLAASKGPLGYGLLARSPLGYGLRARGPVLGHAAMPSPPTVSHRRSVRGILRG